MTALQQAAALHPQSVTEISRKPIRRRRRSNARSANPKLWGFTVHPDLWAFALTRCNGESGRIEAIDETHVYIHNDTSWRNR